MFRWLTYPFIRYLVLYITGIFAGTYLDFHNLVIIAALFMLLIIHALYILLHFRKTDRFGYLTSSSFFLVLFLTGWTRIYQTNHSNYPDHYQYLDSIQYLEGQIVDAPTLKGKYLKFEFKVYNAFVDPEWHRTSGKLLVYLAVDQDVALNLDYGDRLVIEGRPRKPAPPKNPFEFDYNAFLQHQNLYGQMYIKPAQVVKNGRNGNPLLEFGYFLREYCENVIRNNLKAPREQAIAMALILGKKDQLDFDTREAFGSAGAMHVLAVSGLHVGIVYAVFHFLFAGFLTTRAGKLLVPLVLITILWIYAMVTGFSPSVLRAVTMFSLIIIGNSMQRKANIYNSIAVSAFLLLLINPLLLFSVGFQLSYLAVISIVYFHSRIYNLWYIQKKWPDKIWNLTCVSLAAQIGTLPLTLFYFHQFPLLFFISNLVVIPGAFLILLGGFGLIALSGFPGIAVYIGKALEWLIFLQNQFVFGIHQLPLNKLSGFVFDPWQCLILFLIIILSILFFTRKKFFYLPMAVLLIIMFSGISLKRMLINKKQQKILFYSIYKQPVIQFIAGNQGILQQETDLTAAKFAFHIQPNQLYSSIHLNNFRNAPVTKNYRGITLYCWYGKTIALVNEWPPNRFFADPVNIDLMVIRDPARIDFRQLFRSFAVSVLILDTTLSNYQEMKIRKIIPGDLPVHSINNDGYFEIQIKN